MNLCYVRIIIIIIIVNFIIIYSFLWVFKVKVRFISSIALIIINNCASGN